MMRVVKFSASLLTARLRAGLTQEAVATACGLSRSYYANVETGEKPPPLKCIDELVDVLGLTKDTASAMRREAYMMHTPEQVQEMIEALEREADARDEVIKRLAARLDELDPTKAG